MDDRFDKENIEAETRYPRREAVDGHTRYPVREERRPLRFSSEHHTELPGRKIDAENDMTAYEQRTAASGQNFCRIPMRIPTKERTPIREPLIREDSREDRQRSPAAESAFRMRSRGCAERGKRKERRTAGKSTIKNAI